MAIDRTLNSDRPFSLLGPKLGTRDPDPQKKKQEEHRISSLPKVMSDPFGE